MTPFEKIVHKYAKGHDTESMEKLTCKISWFVDKVQEKDPELVKQFLMLTDLLLNPCFTKETAEFVVSKMKNKDGTTGQHWSYDEAVDAMKDQNYVFDEADWYYVLNMIRSDYYKSGRSDETYFEMANDFLADPDAPDSKAKRYYLAMCD